MSLNISLIGKETKEEVMSLNWLRNPFGLERWAESNVGDIVDIVVGTYMELHEEQTLHYVCNHWCYDESDNIDRGQFKWIVDKYWDKIQELEVGYFVFDLPEYRQFVEGKLKRELDHSVGDFEYRKDNTEIAIKMELFEGTKSFDEYKQWFQQLVLFAERLQDADVEFDCSN